MTQLRVEERGTALWLTLDGEASRNALDDDIVVALTEALNGVGSRPGIACVVLTGAGDKVFCAGGNLKADSGPFVPDPNRAQHPLKPMFAAFRHCPVPIVARINGAAVGGGLGMACACDFAIASETAIFATPEVKVGLFPLFILAPMLQVMPRRAVHDLAFTGRRINVHEAKTLGIINDFVPLSELDSRIDALIATLSEHSRTTYAFGRAALTAMSSMSYEESLEYAQRMLILLAQTDDAREGIEAFRAGRKPMWRP
jgi:enoyl-CoA hydratase/carnithine racemase